MARTARADRLIALAVKKYAESCRVCSLMAVASGRKDGGAFTRDQFAHRVFPLLGDRAIEDVNRADLIGLLDTVKVKGKLRTANVLLSDLNQMLRFAPRNDLVPHNPLDTVSKREVSRTQVERDRVLIPPEIHQLAKLLPASELPPPRGAGCTGVSWMLSAAGRKAASSASRFGPASSWRACHAAWRMAL